MERSRLTPEVDETMPGDIQTNLCSVSGSAPTHCCMYGTVVMMLGSDARLPGFRSQCSRSLATRFTSLCVSPSLSTKWW